MDEWNTYGQAREALRADVLSFASQLGGRCTTLMDSGGVAAGAACVSDAYQDVPGDIDAAASALRNAASSGACGNAATDVEIALRRLGDAGDELIAAFHAVDVSRVTAAMPVVSARSGGYVDADAVLMGACQPAA